MILRPSVRVRDAEAQDAAAWRALWDGYVAFYRGDVPEAVTARTWANILDPASSVFCRVAEDGGEVVGIAVCLLHDATWAMTPACYLEDLFVAPAARGRGVGRALIEDLLALGRARGWSRLYWHTDRGNETARRLYDAWGPADDFVRYAVPL